MDAQHQSGSETKATTSSRKLLATAMIGAALIGYQVHKTPDARTRLESLASLAYRMGDISEVEAAIVYKAMARTGQHLRTA
ncbi:hypothetical protein [Pseudomonas ovata]|uniref:hypothetical protein n=1 Tax=Pseudomonas ovata TaxID=1839709 RepID=UPI000D68D7A6|nr:hypothetical protein [Pseudomonas ovata]